MALSKKEKGLAMLAGARAIAQGRRYWGATFCRDAFGENPKEIEYFRAAQILRELGDALLAGEVGE